MRRAKDGLKSPPTLTGALLYFDFSDAYELLSRQRKRLSEAQCETLDALGPHLARVIAVRNRVAHTRPMEIDDSSFLIDVATELMRGHKDSLVNLDETLARLSQDPSFVLGLTIKLPIDPEGGPRHNLPVPDFDETGFFGRQAELRRIKRAIKGAYPVVSILGDGGIGKTSIALKAAYELLEDPDQQFDAIVWVTAKATILTTNEIRRISGAIESSIGLFASAAAELGGPTGSDPVEEVLAYMENFKILLVLDNLETVLDQRLRDFLLELPLGSKVIITSRIGLGIENPVQLTPMSLDESTKLLRALCRIRGVRQLSGLTQSSVESLAKRMAGHPLYMRWFVAAVQAGRRPEELLASNELMLDFCMSNVYEYLGDEARGAVRSMQVIPGAKNQAELAYLNQFTASQTQAVLLELITTNFVQTSSQPGGQALETTYQLSEFAAQYLDKHHPVDPEERQWLLGQAEALRNLGMRVAADGSTQPYAASTIHVRGHGDFHPAGQLADALANSEVDPKAAISRCNEVQILAPGYFEAWRVEAQIQARLGDHAAAIAAFERALELADSSPALLYHQGDFLLNVVGDCQRALGVLQTAARYDPLSADIAGQIAWCHYAIGDYSSALDAVSHLLEMSSVDRAFRKASCGIALLAGMAGISAAMYVRDFDLAVEYLEASVATIESVERTELVGEPGDLLLALHSQTERLGVVAEGYSAGGAIELRGRLEGLIRDPQVAVTGRKLGIVKSVVADKGYGFIRHGSENYFFHVNHLLDSSHWDLLTEGEFAVFEPVPSHRKGPRAQKVRLVLN